MNSNDILDMIGDAQGTYVWDAQEVRSGTIPAVTKRKIPIKKTLWVAAAIALLAATITACAYVIQRMKLNLVQHNLPAQTESVIADIDQPEETTSVNILTDCYPQKVPDGYRILCGEPTDYNSRNIQYCKDTGNTITFWISTMPTDEEMVLRPPAEEVAVTISGKEATLKSNEGAQVLRWENPELGYYANLFTDDVTVDLTAMAESVAFGTPVPVSVWYHRGQEWNPWYPQTLPEGYACTDVSSVASGFQCFTYGNEADGYIRFGISTLKDLAPAEISDQGYWEEAEVNGVAAKVMRNQSTQRTLFWHNQTEGFYAFLETVDDAVDLVALAECVGPGPKMEVSKAYLGPDYTIELEQDPTVYVEWQSVYPQNIPDGYRLEHVGNPAYGQQTIEWVNAEGNSVIYTLYFRLGQYERQFDGIGEPEPVTVNGLAGFRTGNSLLWADGNLGFGYELFASDDLDLIALAESVGPGPELALTNDKTAAALEELGDYQITELPDNMIEDGLSGSPLEDGGDWYSYVRRWYYDRSNNDHVYFTYETYLTECTNMEERLRLLISLSMTSEPEYITINGYPGITMQDGSRATVAWVIGDVNKGVSFQLYSEQFAVDELLAMANSIQKK